MNYSPGSGVKNRMKIVPINGLMPINRAKERNSKGDTLKKHQFSAIFGSARISHQLSPSQQKVGGRCGLANEINVYRADIVEVIGSLLQ
jgi:hypothetical protein